MKNVLKQRKTGKAHPGNYSRNADTLSKEMAWFSRMLEKRFRDYFGAFSETAERNTGEESISVETEPIPVPLPPDISGDCSDYAAFVNEHSLSTDERLLLILLLIPHIKPQLLDFFFTSNTIFSRGYTEFGGIKGNHHSGFIPTIETVLFLLAGNDLEHRLSLHTLFEPDHLFLTAGIIAIEHGSGNEPFSSSLIRLTEEYVDYFTVGIIRKPLFSMEFPARQLKTGMSWGDLVVDEFTARQLDELRIWLRYGQTLYEQWGLGSRFKPGFKALFYGPPGTGKTLTAALLGKLYKLDVYRIDLSMVISKYIGETEKNLEKVFIKAQNKKWILFFDEADALFGKRTGISDSHDKFANQEIAYLLQRLEDYPGLVILASNMRNNVDEAFTRRLQSIICFQKPQPRERYLLWKNAFGKVCTPPGTDALKMVADQYDLSGGSIMNIVQFASLQALSRNETSIRMEDLVEGIRKEYRKEGKTI